MTTLPFDESCHISTIRPSCGKSNVEHVSISRYPPRSLTRFRCVCPARCRMTFGYRFSSARNPEPTTAVPFSSRSEALGWCDATTTNSPRSAAAANSRFKNNSCRTETAPSEYGRPGNLCAASVVSKPISRKPATGDTLYQLAPVGRFANPCPTGPVSVSNIASMNSVFVKNRRAALGLTNRGVSNSSGGPGSAGVTLPCAKNPTGFSNVGSKIPGRSSNGSGAARNPIADRKNANTPIA